MKFKWEEAFGKAMLSCVALLGLSSTLSAANDERRPNFAFAYPKDLCLKNPYDFYFYVEGLAMQGMETGLSYALLDKSPAASASVHGSIRGFGEHGSWDYNFGTRAGWGIYLNHDAWNFDVDWMWINITNSDSFQGGTGRTLPLLYPSTGVLPTNISSCGATWGCVVNVVDATLGKPYYISRKVTFNPHFGLRFAEIDQHLGINYGGTFPSTHTKIQTQNDFFGVGGRVGVNTDWELCSGFKLFGNLSSSLLAGWFNNFQKFNVPLTSSTVNERDNLQLVVPNLELALGVDWGTHLDDKNFFLDFRFGYEFQMWWNQWNMRQFTTGVSTITANFSNVANRGDLTLSGFTFKIQLDM